MRVTEIRIKLADNPVGPLLAFCSVLFDDAFAVKDMKVIDGPTGPFLSMPSRKKTARCRCGTKNPLRARFCSWCGVRLADDRVPVGEEGPASLYADVAHPVTSEFRDTLQDAVLTAYRDELARSRRPGYVCPYADFSREWAS